MPLKEIDFRRELRKATPVNVTRTNPNHAKGTLPTRDAYRNREVRRNFEAAPDGNQVILEEQMQKVGDTRGQYNMAITLMQKHMQMLKTALGKRGG